MNKYVFITGATAGFGEACAHIFAQNNWSLILTGRREERLLELKQKLQSETVQVHTLCFDVRSEASCKEQIESLPENIKENIEIVINNAGLAVGRGSLENAITDDWERMIDTNIKGLLYVSKYMIPILKANKSGHIVNLGSIAGKEVYAGGNVYCASKHAVDSLSILPLVQLKPSFQWFGLKEMNKQPILFTKVLILCKQKT
jgi:3-hydroxy acid dehydrogenase / malonic semialdehyde reductase